MPMIYEMIVLFKREEAHHASFLNSKEQPWLVHIAEKAHYHANGMAQLFKKLGDFCGGLK